MSEIPIPQREQTNLQVQQLWNELTSVRNHNLSLVEELLYQRTENARLEAFIQSNTHKATTSFPRVLSNLSIASTAPGLDSDQDTSFCGAPDSRWAKILKYKAKQRRHRERVAISRQFRGRSQVAKTKPRINGKFVKPTAC